MNPMERAPRTMPRPSAAARLLPQPLKNGARGGLWRFEIATLNAWRISRIVKGISLRSALLPAILAIAFSGSCRADEVRAKIQYCTECHGASGRGYHGYYPIPRLAGQTSQYIQNQLRAFIEHRRETDIGMNMAKVHGISPAMRTSIAAHFEDLEPAPLRDAPRGLIEAGKKIFEDGVPEANVPACAACHGPEAKGGGEIPRLAGQLYPFTVKELANWSKERTGSEASTIMRTVAGNMTKSQIEAVAAYVNHLN